MSYYGEIHNAVVSYLAAKHMLLKEYTVGNCRFDLYNPNTKEVWEVKPISYINTDTWRSNSLDEQLQRYYSTGACPGHPLGNDTFLYGEYVVNIYSEIPAKIYYTFEQKNSPQEEPVPVPVPETQKENVSDESIDWANLLGVGVAIVGVGILVGTVIEDIATSGAGIADDPASFAAGGSLIASGWNQLTTFFNQMGNWLENSMNGLSHAFSW